MDCPHTETTVVAFEEAAARMCADCGYLTNMTGVPTPRKPDEEKVDGRN